MRRQTAGEGNSQGILAGQGNSQVPFKLQCRTRALLHRLCHKHVVAWSRLFCYPETCMILIFPVIGFKLSQAHSLWQRSRTLSQLFTCRGTWSAAVHMAATVKGRERPAAFRRFSETRLPIGFTVCHWSGFFFFFNAFIPVPNNHMLNYGNKWLSGNSQNAPSPTQEENLPI